MKRRYDINQIDERMLRYANAYIKQVVNNAQKNYYRNCLKHTRYDISFEEYNDNIVKFTPHKTKKNYLLISTTILHKKGNGRFYIFEPYIR